MKQLIANIKASGRIALILIAGPAALILFFSLVEFILGVLS